MASLKTDLEKIRERESNLSRERAELATTLEESEQARLINQEPGLSIEQLRSVEAKLDQEKLGRQRAETQSQEKVGELSMLTVDNRQLQYRLDKLEADYRQESEKVRSYAAQLERVPEEKSLMQSEMSVRSSEITLLKTNEKRLVRDSSESRA